MVKKESAIEYFIFSRGDWENNLRGSFSHVSRSNFIRSQFECKTSKIFKSTKRIKKKKACNNLDTIPNNSCHFHYIMIDSAS